MFYRVEQRDSEVLDDAVESHELEHAEGRDERSPALSSQRTEMAVRRVWELSLNVCQRISFPRHDVPQMI